jgi:MFS family permease
VRALRQGHVCFYLNLPVSLPVLFPRTLLRRNMAASTADATAYGIMVGIGETYLPAFALAVGLGEVTAGLVGIIPLLAGGIVQSISPWIMRRGVSEKAWILCTALLQALAFLPLILTAFSGGISAAWLLFFASIYWSGGLATGPAWNSWIERIIPKSIRTNYFACRTRASQFATLLGFLTGGVLLQYSRANGLEVLAFAGLFGAALFARLVSVCMLSLHRIAPEKRARTVALAREFTGNQSTAIKSTAIESTAIQRIAARQLIIYLVMVQGMVQVSGPFFTPYMLVHLKLSYLGYAGLIAVAFLAKIIAVGAWGRFAKKRGAQWLLVVGGAMIIPLAPFWMLSDSYYWLLLIQSINGVSWAAYELGFFLMFFESMPIQKRVKMLTIYNLANTSAWLLGAMVGATILSQLGRTPGAYHTLFVVSSFGRGLAFIYLVTHRQQLFVKVHKIGFRILGLRPNSAPVETPILSTLDDEPTAESDSKSFSRRKCSAG